MRSMVEGSGRPNPPRGFEDCRGQSGLPLAIEKATPLRQGFALPPPLAGEEWIYARGGAVESRSIS